MTSRDRGIAADVDHQSVQWRMHFPLPAARVYEALDRPEQRACYWAVSAEEQAGIIAFVFRNGTTESSRILERQPPRRWVIEYFGSVLVIDLRDDGLGGTDLLLSHSGIPEGDWVDVHAGWLNVLFPLKAWLLAGIDLRTNDPARTWDRGYADG